MSNPLQQNITYSRLQSGDCEKHMIYITFIFIKPFSKALCTVDKDGGGVILEETSPMRIEMIRLKNLSRFLSKR